MYTHIRGLFGNTGKIQANTFFLRTIHFISEHSIRSRLRTWRSPVKYRQVGTVKGTETCTECGDDIFPGREFINFNRKEMRWGESQLLWRMKSQMKTKFVRFRHCQGGFVERFCFGERVHFLAGQSGQYFFSAFLSNSPVTLHNTRLLFCRRPVSSRVSHSLSLQNIDRPLST